MRLSSVVLSVSCHTLSAFGVPFSLTLFDIFFFSPTIIFLISFCDCHALALDQNGPLEGCEMIVRNPIKSPRKQYPKSKTVVF